MIDGVYVFFLNNPPKKDNLKAVDLLRFTFFSSTLVTISVAKIAKVANWRKNNCLLVQHHFI